MNISQVELGAVYAYIKDHYKSQGCAASVEDARAVKVAEKVRMPAIQLDGCGRKTTIFQTMFRVEFYDLPPAHMFADSLDLCAGEGILVEERFITAKDMVCDWVDEVHRAREMAQLSAIAERYEDYLKGLMYFAVRCHAQTPEIYNDAGKLEIALDSSWGDFIRMLKCPDAEWYRLNSGYHRNAALPEIGFNTNVSRRGQQNLIQYDDTRGIYNWSPGTGTEWAYSVKLPTTQAFCLACRMPPVPDPPPALTKTGKRTVAYSKWMKKADKAHQELIERVSKLPWKERHVVATNMVHHLTSHVLLTLPKFVLDIPRGMKTAAVIERTLTAFDPERPWAQWKDEMLDLLQSHSEETGAQLPRYYTEEGE